MTFEQNRIKLICVNEWLTMRITMPTSSPIWTPSPERIATSNLKKFIEHINMQGEAIENYAQLHQWSIVENKKFWMEIWTFCDVIGYQGDCIVGEGKPKWGNCFSQRDNLWFPQAELNYAENLLSSAYQKPQEPSIIFRNERNEESSLSWQELCDQVSILQQWLIRNGVGKGDVVAGYLPYLPETVIAMLATTSLGAVWTSTSPDFGTDSVIERLGQVNPKILFCCDGYSFNGKTFDMSEKNRKIAEQLPDLLNICEIEYLESPETDYNTNYSTWAAIIENYDAKGIIYERVSFNSPLFILYSSGTTGKPKCIIHTVGGTIINHLKEHQLHCDIQPDDRVFYYTTCGWMMWNWHVSTLASGATLVIYDGSPVYPEQSVLWDMLDDCQVTLFGTSAKYLEAIQHAHYEPALFHDLSTLKTICSTGSVLYPEQFDFVYSSIKSDVHLASISGGTDICGCFVLGNPISPVYRGEVQYAGLGVSIAVYDTSGQPVVEQRGELVCTNSLPNYPLGFWHDDGERYHQSYWSKYPNVWHHGDDVIMTNHGGFVFYGRSDTTLNPGGVRIGTAELYQQVNALNSIDDSIAVGKVKDRSEEIWLFVKPATGFDLSDSIAEQIRSTLRNHCSPRHVPSQIFAISEIPKTRSGKLVELAVKQVVNGEEVKNLGAIANPEALEEIKRVTQAYR
ncbi:TPA: acetoacetate--CoA ligase [Vibrio vulnificus]|nr:acetoacetate--CoA ligase [Vibrio vulnificus]EGQ7950067.1 acetoacetate--CoA ligase [Vibrio vulnificus]EGQ7992197.1 acetoacetate--CoA ligase [Vibrio vulnificus]EGR0099630.1 acetoacetate--CoA ligase [Vibrio vulnificus]RZP82257.1 acetoacetate--CoA ligase [Vibrio vulnificus]